MPKDKVRIEAGSKSFTPRQITAAGDIRVQVTIIWIVGIIVAILAIGAIVFTFYNPGESKNLWVIVGPIISATITGVLGFLAGKRQTNSKTK